MNKDTLLQAIHAPLPLHTIKGAATLALFVALAAPVIWDTAWAGAQILHKAITPTLVYK